MSNIAAVILAAGKGTRMKSKLPKALHKLCGKPMTRYIVDACRQSGIDRCIVVVGYGADQVMQGLGSDIEYVVQEDQLGTGHACREALPLLADLDGDVLVAIGDAPLLSSEIISGLIKEHRAADNDATILTTKLDDAKHYGRIIRNESNEVIGIVEAKDASPDQIEIDEINTAIYCFKAPVLRRYLHAISNENAQGEYYLTDVIGLMHADGCKLGSFITDDTDAVLGINDRVELAAQTAKIRRKILELHMLNGVTVVDPESTYVDIDVQIGQDTELNPQTYIEGQSIIGQNCVVGPSTRLSNMKIGDNVTIIFSDLADSTIGNGTRIGPFAHLRPGCVIGNNVKIGNFVETKNAAIEDRVSIGHLSYVGDASIGEHTNIGAGTITCNYDGFRKHRTIIGKEVFIGSHTTLIAPVEVGDGALTAAGSVITSDVPPDALAISRPELKIKEGKAKERRERLQKELEKRNG